MYHRFSDRARKVIQLANLEAQRFNYEYIGPEQILLGLIKEGDGVGVHVLKSLGVDMAGISAEIEKILACRPETSERRGWPRAPQVKKVLEFAITEAKSLGHNHVGTEHLLLGILQVPGIGAQVLGSFGIGLEAMRDSIRKALGNSGKTSVQQIALARFARKLGFWVGAHKHIAIFIGGTFITLGGAGLGATFTGKEGVDVGAMLAGSAFIVAVLIRSFAARRPAQSTGRVLHPK